MVDSLDPIVSEASSTDRESDGQSDMQSDTSGNSLSDITLTYSLTTKDGTRQRG